VEWKKEFLSSQILLLHNVFAGSERDALVEIVQGKQIFSQF
jgi:hypothetical protein